MNVRLGLAFVFPFIAAALQWMLWPWLRPFVWFLFFPTVFLSAGVAGFWGGLASTLISTGLVWFLFLPPQLSWELAVLDNVYSVSLFLVMGVLISDVQERLRRARRIVEHRLDESENRFEAIFDQAAVGISVLSLEGKWLRVNHKLCAIVGYTQDELLTTTFQQITHPDDLDTDIGLVEKMLANEIETYTLEKRYIHRAGHAIWINLTVSLARHADGTPNYFISVIEEIGQRKQIETDLSKFKAIVDSSSDAIISETPGGIITSWNAGAEHLFGYRAAEAIGRSLDMLIPPERLHEEREILARIGRSEHIDHVETVRIRKNGQPIHVSLTISPILDATGKAVGASRIARDVTPRKRAEAEIEAGSAKLEAALAAMRDAVVIADTSGHFVHFNDAFVSYYRFRNRQDCARTLGEYPDIIDIYTAGGELLPMEQWAVPRALRGESASNVEFIVQRRDSGERWAGSYTFAPIYSSERTITGAVVTVRDITERKAVEDELRIAAITFDANEGMMVTDAFGKIIKVNANFCKITGYTAPEVTGRPSSILQSGRHNTRFYDLMWKDIVETGCWTGEIWNKRKNGEIFPAHLHITCVRNGAGQVSNYVAAITDVSTHEAAVDEIKHLAFFDPLTGLPNRRLLLDRLQQALATGVRSGREGAVLFIDLDDFKMLNDSLGHDFGDLLLQQVAERLIDCVREGDTVARFGGDEFVIVLENLSAQPHEAAAQTEAVGEKILGVINQPFMLAGHAVRTTPSIGAALFAGHYGKLDDLLKQADFAMYQAKKAGRNRLRFFDPQMQESINQRAALEKELHQGIEKQEFELFYQLQLHHSGQPVGIEALLRWHHPLRGTLLPASFVGLAEETGLMPQLGSWVLETACAQLQAWRDLPQLAGLTLAVNLSAAQARHPEFVASVQRALRRHAIAPGRLKLEISERLLLEDFERLHLTMQSLSRLGVLFAIDDFGTGHSSLRHLRRLPLSQLKIDESFVQAIGTDADGCAIIATIIAMARSLSLGVLAEGVETAAQRQFLHENGCSEFQGYLFGQPLAHDDFVAAVVAAAAARSVAAPARA